MNFLYLSLSAAVIRHHPSDFHESVNLSFFTRRFFFSVARDTMMRNLRLIARAATKNLLNGRDSLFLLYESFGFSHLFRLEAWKHMRTCIVIIQCNAALRVHQNVLILTWQRAKIRTRKNFFPLPSSSACLRFLHFKHQTTAATSSGQHACVLECFGAFLPKSFHVNALQLTRKVAEEEAE